MQQTLQRVFAVYAPVCYYDLSVLYSDDDVCAISRLPDVVDSDCQGRVASIVRQRSRAIDHR
jgi:hypothetical protein